MCSILSLLSSDDISDYQHPRLRSQKVMDIYDGSYRVFINFYKNGKQITLGYPKSNCSDKRVWLAFDGAESGRIELHEANRYLDSGQGLTLKLLIPNLSNSTPAAKPQTYFPRVARASLPVKRQTYSGHCIRCGKNIKHNTNRPLCSSCFSSWAKWGNDDYDENYCHTCGKSWITSKSRPECKKCYYS